MKIKDNIFFFWNLPPACLISIVHYYMQRYGMQTPETTWFYNYKLPTFGKTVISTIFQRVPSSHSLTYELKLHEILWYKFIIKKKNRTVLLILLTKSTLEMFHKVQWVLWKRGKHWSTFMKRETRHMYRVCCSRSKISGKKHTFKKRKNWLMSPKTWQVKVALASSNTPCVFQQSPAHTGPALCPVLLWRDWGGHTLHHPLNLLLEW